MKFVPQEVKRPTGVDIDGKPTGWEPALTKSNVPPLKFFKDNPGAFDPLWATTHSACFDLKACLTPGLDVKMFGVDNVAFTVQVTPGTNTIKLQSGHRALVPTGLIFDIPVGYSVRLHSRSGLAAKQALTLANHEGVIDSDYVDPTFILLYNGSSMEQTITHGDRLAQGEMIPDMAYDVTETKIKPQVKTDRTGGLGSTGVA